jgi:iron complex outermembrane receptor protein
MDQVTLASVTYDRSFAKGSASARLHSGRYHYYGEYAYDATAPNQDMAFGEWWGIDLDASRSISARNLLTVGLEYRDNYRQDQKNYTPEPYTMLVNDYNQSERLGVFAQNELTLFKPLILYTGVRQDWYDTFGAATSPRLGLIYNPGDATTLKLLVGRAFRAPNEYELHYGGGLIYKLNPLLGPERIQTLELAAEHRIGHGLRATASAFRNHITDLISLQRDPVDDLLVFRNVGRINSKGLELGLALNRGRGVTGALGATWQKTSDHETDIELKSAPERMVKLQLGVPLVKEQLSTAIDAQYVSARGTLSGAQAKEYIVTNISLLAPRLFHRIETSATLYNLFDTKYGNPGSEEHVQDIIQQDGRSFRVKATLRF